MSMNYQQGKIYKIVSSSTDRIYIGSTYKTLLRRFAGHGSNFKRYQKGTYSYVSSFDLLRFDDAEIHLVESYPCESKQALLARETYWMREYRSVIVNKHVASTGLTKLEYNKQRNETLPRFNCTACNYFCDRRAKQKHLRTKKHIDNQLNHDFAIFISDLD